MMKEKIHVETVKIVSDFKILVKIFLSAIIKNDKTWKITVPILLASSACRSSWISSKDAKLSLFPSGVTYLGFHH